MQVNLMIEKGGEKFLKRKANLMMRLAFLSVYYSSVGEFSAGAPNKASAAAL